MDEILKKLFESDLLSEETKATLTEQFKTAVDAYLVEQRAQLETEVNARLTEEFVKAREELVESLNTKLDEMVKGEFDELKGDIEQYRDLEVEFAEKLVEEKEQLAVRFGEEMEELVNKLDMFLEQRVDAEFDELKEDITEVKKLELGRKIVEAFGVEYKKIFKEDTSKTERELAEALDKLADAQKRLTDIDRQRVTEARQNKLDELLAPLTGSTREQMKLILNNVSTEKLDEAYKVYLARVLKESTVAAPSAPVAKPAEQVKTSLTESKVVTGNEGEAEETQAVTESTEPNSALSRMRKLAGLA
jgi:hypothetical protein